MAGVVTTRMGRRARREQLLDAAAAVVERAGIAAVTMEGVAAEAGVSKAIPYRHFANAAELLRVLHDRELERLARRVLAAVGDDGMADDRLRAGVHAYFDVLHERGQLLSLLGAATGDDDAARARRGPAFMGSLLTELYRVPARSADLLGATLLGALLGATETWARGDAGRARAERVACATMIAAVHAAAPAGSPAV